ncbi:MAG: maleylacetoacetate isomerase [Devosia sp.]|uniref:maleylacetoacetate isomerase n=1 Tax=Devosia sp. TaxID=1871048 RepID=UPI00260F6595|nr:maleylacetoacetate isomerase [Devosia sp.]MDB5585875.1 maleylacetoacetate isomerase [Devosia sp.]
MDMKLYTRAQNSAGERVRIALNLKGIAYEYVAVSTLGPGEYARINPQALMPALEVHGRVITQSAAILNYLEAAFPERALLPADLVVRAQAIAFGSVVAAEMHALTVQRVRRFLSSNMGTDEAQVQQWVAHWLGLGFATLEGLLAARSADWPFCFGEEPGWADLFMVPQVANGRRLGIDLTDYQRVTEIADRCRQLEPFRLAEPQMQPDYPGEPVPR